MVDHDAQHTVARDADLTNKDVALRHGHYLQNLVREIQTMQCLAHGAPSAVDSTSPNEPTASFLARRHCPLTGYSHCKLLLTDRGQLPV